jgi:hypothetical protein
VYAMQTDGIQYDQVRESCDVVLLRVV